jgi:hypothetical protein
MIPLRAPRLCGEILNFLTTAEFAKNAEDNMFEISVFEE